MSKIKAIDLVPLRNHAHFQFMMAVVALIVEFSAARLGIAALFDALKAAVDREDDVLKKIVKSEITEKIRMADKARDRVFSCLTAIIRALVKHYNDDVAEAARRLKIVVDAYGKNVNQLSLNEETSAIYNLLQEFNGKHADDVELVRITEMVAELERTNKAVDALITERDVETAAKNPESMKEARADSDAAYHAVVERVNALVIVEGEDNYAEFIARLNVIIDNYKLLIAKSHHAKKEEEPEAGTEEK